MEEYALRIAKAIKNNGKQNNNLKCLTGIIKKQEPLIVEAYSGQLSFEEGKNLKLDEDIKSKMLQDTERKEYIGREILLIGIQEFIAFAVLV